MSQYIRFQSSLSGGGGGGGITSINGDSTAAQLIAAGTSGSDISVATLSGTTTINVPIASATKTGKLSSTDWSTFNSKLSTETDPLSIHLDGSTSPTATIDWGTQNLTNVGTISANALTAPANLDISAIGTITLDGASLTGIQYNPTGTQSAVNPFGSFWYSVFSPVQTLGNTNGRNFNVVQDWVDTTAPTGQLNNFYARVRVPATYSTGVNSTLINGTFYTDAEGNYSGTGGVTGVAAFTQSKSTGNALYNSFGNFGGGLAAFAASGGLNVGCVSYATAGSVNIGAQGQVDGGGSSQCAAVFGQMNINGSSGPNVGGYFLLNSAGQDTISWPSTNVACLTHMGDQTSGDLHQGYGVDFTSATPGNLVYEVDYLGNISTDGTLTLGKSGSGAYLQIIRGTAVGRATYLSNIHTFQGLTGSDIFVVDFKGSGNSLVTLRAQTNTQFSDLLWSSDDDGTEAHGDIGFNNDDSTMHRPRDIYAARDMLAGRNVRITGNLGVGNSAAATTPGTITKKIEIFDASGTSLGFIAVYDSIT